MPSVKIVRIEILVFVSLLLGAGDACLNTQVKETPKCTNGLCVPPGSLSLGRFLQGQECRSICTDEISTGENSLL